jgi:hypothetical protein
LDFLALEQRMSRTAAIAAGRALHFADCLPPLAGLSLRVTCVSRA